MCRRRAPVVRFVVGLLASACTPVIPSELELDVPEEPDEDSSDAPLPLLEDVDDDPSPPVDETAALPTELCASGPTSQAAVEVTDTEDPGGGRLLTELANGRVMGLPLQRTRFETMVVGTVAETTVTQTFENTLSEAIEVVYIFPLPHDGAVDDYSLRVGERTLRGKIHRRAEAQQVYEEAKKAGHTAGLLEQERPNVFTQRVANVAPGEVIEVSMHVVQPLAAQRGRFELVLPTVVGPRFIPGAPRGTSVGSGVIADTDRVPDASRITPPVLPPGLRTCGDLEIEVSIDAGGPIAAVSSTSHRVDIDPDHLGAMVRLDERYALLNRDFVLSWRRRGGATTATMQAQPDADGDGGWLTLTVQPPTRLDTEDLPGRELVFVVDASGSMMGAPMAMAKATMRRFIDGLGPDDAFTVLRFSDDVSGLGDQLLPRTDENIERALAYVDGLEGEGGTHMTAGIRAALGVPRRSDRVRYVVFLTDGYIGNEAEVFELVGQEIGDARIFAMGVGTSVNRYLLDGLARMGRGTVTYVDLEQPTEPVVERIYDKLRQPALVDLVVAFDGLEVHDVAPSRMPDLFVGEPVVVFARYEGPLRGRAVVQGRRGDARVELPVSLHAVRDEDVDGVRSMWAREQIDELQLDPTLAFASDARRKQRIEQVTALSLEHRVITEYTAFVAADESRVIDGHSRGTSVMQGVDLAAGMAHEATWGHLGLPGGDGSDGSIGLGSGGGSGAGYGKGHGAGFGGRGSRMPRVRMASAQVKGSLDAVIIRRIVRAHRNEIRHCYNRGLALDPTIAGRVVIQFVIDVLGNVSVSTVASTELPDEAVGQCMANAVKRWRFPKAEGGGHVLVNYPFVLSPK